MRPEARRELSRLFKDARFDEPLRRYTTFRIGGTADAFVTARNDEDLVRLHRFIKKRRTPMFVIGWGSNLLIRDGGIRGIVLHLSGDFGSVRFPEPGVVEAGAAVRLPQLVLKCAKKGLAGTEPLVGVPGTVGGALVMNAGTRDGEIGDLVECVYVFDPERLERVRLTRSRIRFRYRSSSLKRRLVLGCRLSLKGADPSAIIDRVKGYQQVRLRTQPVHSFNVGSVFKNPPGHFVAKLIEEAGLKGFALGGARVSPKHANFIENSSRAKASDVLALVEKIQSTVLERTGIELELEMKVVGS